MISSMKNREIKWAAAARKDLRSITTYIREHNPQAAQDFVVYLRKTIKEMALSPRPIGRLGEYPGSIERVLTRYKSYLLIFSYDDNIFRVLRVFHTSQDNKSKEALM